MLSAFVPPDVKFSNYYFELTGFNISCGPTNKDMQTFIVALITWACTVIAPEATSLTLDKIQSKENPTTQVIRESDSLQVRR